MSARLSARDHTKIIRIAFENPLLILKHLKLKDYIIQNRRPDAIDILRAASKIKSIDDDTRGKIKQVTEVYTKIMGLESKMPSDAKRAIDDINKMISKTPSYTTSEMIRTLEKIKKSGVHSSVKGVKEGLDFAIEMMRDGSSTIYKDNFSPIFIQLATEETKVRGDSEQRTARRRNEYLEAEAKGAIVGGIGGSIFGGVVGAALGAAGGAAAASGQKILDVIFDDLFA